VLYRGVAAPIEVDWSWQPASAAAILHRAVVLFDRSAGLPIAQAWQTLEPANSARQLSLSTTFFWAMAFITAKKIVRRQPVAPREALPSMRLQDHLVDLSEMLAEMQGLQRTTHGAGGVVTEEAVAAVRGFVQLIAQDARQVVADRLASA